MFYSFGFLALSFFGFQKIAKVQEQNIFRKTPKFRMELKENRQKKNITFIVEKQNTQKFKKFEKQGRRCEEVFFFFQNSFLIFSFFSRFCSKN